MVTRIITRRVGEATDRATTHMPALRPVSRIPRTVAELVGAVVLGLFTLGALVVFL